MRSTKREGRERGVGGETGHKSIHECVLTRGPREVPQHLQL